MRFPQNLSIWVILNKFNKIGLCHFLNSFQIYITRHNRYFFYLTKFPELLLNDREVGGDNVGADQEDLDRRVAQRKEGSKNL